MAPKPMQKKRKSSSVETSTTKKPRTSKATTTEATTQDAQADAGVPDAVTATPAVDEVYLDDADESDGSASEDDQTAALLKGFDNPSSEDEDEAEESSTPFDTTSLPDPSKAMTLAKSSALTKSAQTTNTDPTVLYISRIPHGFFEPQMRAYFSQFGDIRHLRLARNRRTGASKHYAFMEFSSSEVASIVARTMDNYLMFKHILKVKLVPREQVHEKLWKGADRRFRKVPWNRIEKTRVAKTDREGWSKRVDKEAKRREEKQAKLKALGYDFEAPKLTEVESVPVQQLDAPEAPKALEASAEQVSSVPTTEAEKTIVEEKDVAAQEDDSLVASNDTKDKKAGKAKVKKATKAEGGSRKVGSKKATAAA